MTPRILLLQIRDRDDPMADHEHDCVRRRVEPIPATVVRRNGLIEPASAAWVDEVDMVIFGGSGDYSVHHPCSQQWVNALRKLIDRALEREVPSFGICFGHQLLGYHLGSAVNTSDAHAELGTVPLSLTAEGQRDPVFSDLEPDFLAHTGHSDHVRTVPEGVTLLATGTDCATQAFKVADAPFYSTQFHPDMTGAEASSRYLAYKQSLSNALDDPSICGASKFRAGADQATVLLRRFVEHYRDR